jgi:hypothetical protein
MKNRFETDFEYYTELIKSNANFAYARYADGEVALMRGNPVGTNTQAFSVDRWSSPNFLTKVGKELLSTLNHTENNYHYAISSHSDNVDDYNFLISRISSPNITFANLWINANYRKMFEFYNSLDKNVYLICNHKSEKNNFPFNVNEIFPFPDDCISYWEQNGDIYISEIVDYVSKLKNETFFISAGPISEILIHHMYLSNPNNQYIDVGSSIDEFTHGRKTRPYMYLGSIYSREVSEFKETTL